MVDSWIGAPPPGNNLQCCCSGLHLDSIITAFDSMFVSYATMNRRFCSFVSEDMSPQRHLPIKRPPELSSKKCYARVAGTHSYGLVDSSLAEGQAWTTLPYSIPLPNLALPN
ncbi:hypothetical protein Y032_0085g1826 [Ancylostoma ceylanicum]|uniref:Uncharacterized protein n=1 Tax=Ancylostoma ceylanicum TaxID=53326 RepID=A0A016TQ26_9BILA|nr:hypothetical protein Y032_0085g1826 [Ancylostoma ceylanicum]